MSYNINMNINQSTKIKSDYMGNDQFEVTRDGIRVGIIRHIKRENIRTFSRFMTTDRTWVVAGQSGRTFRTKTDAINAL